MKSNMAEEAARIMGGIKKNVDAKPTEKRAGWFESNDPAWVVEIGWDGLPRIPEPDPVYVPSDEADRVEKLRSLMRHAADQIRKRHYLNATNVLLQAQALTLELFAGVLHR